MTNNDLPVPDVLFSEEQIAARIAEMGRQLSRDYQDKHLSIVAVSNGAIPFVADLIRQITVPMHLDTISVHSYIGTESSGQINFRSQLKLDIEDRHVLLVDDILDTGRTFSKILDYLATLKPQDLRTCVLLDKPDRRVTEVQADYIGFTIPDHFVVGYGLDFNEYYRNLPYIGLVKDLA